MTPALRLSQSAVCASKDRHSGHSARADANDTALDASAIAKELIRRAHRGRRAYIEADHLVDKLVARKPGFLLSFQDCLQHELETACCRLNVGSNVQSCAETCSYTHVFDLWCDAVRRSLVDQVRYRHRLWQPTVMCIEITQQCNAVCGHCASDSSPQMKTRLSADAVTKVVREAAAAGVRYLGITGGEPFLEFQAVIAAIRAATESGILFDYINSNGFWAKSEEQAITRLEQIRAVAHPAYVKRTRGMFSLSVTTEHRRFVPLQNVVHAIRAHQKVFPGQTMELVSVRGPLFGNAQAPLLEQIVDMLSSDVLQVSRDSDQRITRIKLKNCEVDIFYNYIVPIGRGEHMRWEDYEHYKLSRKDLAKGLSWLNLDGTVAQTITVGWDGYCAPDIVLKCSEALTAGSIYHSAICEIIAHGNNDPLLRGALTSAKRIVKAAKCAGLHRKMLQRCKYHNTTQGYVSEFMRDPKFRLCITLELLKEDIMQQAVVQEDGTSVASLDSLILGMLDHKGRHILAEVAALDRLFEYDYNLSRAPH